MHPPGAEGGKCVHPEFKSSARIKLAITLNIRRNCAHAGCIAFKIAHPGLKSCKEGAPLISNIVNRFT